MGAEMDGVGSLEASVKEINRRWGESADIVWVVGTNVSYAPAIEFGAAPHVITPNDAQVLNFTVNGQEVFTQKVNHPGNDAQPFLRPALDTAQRKLPGIAKASRSVGDLVERTALVVEAEAKRRAPVKSGNLRGSIEARRA